MKAVNYRELCLELAETARELSTAGAPSVVGIVGVENDYVSATQDALVKFLGGLLNFEEMTVLSLARGFGPVPAFSTKAELMGVGAKLWPDKNVKGLRLSWVELAEKLEGLYPA